MQQRVQAPDDTDDSQTKPPTDVLSELPPSAKLVAKTLEYNDDALTQGELADKTLLPARTVRYALTQLEDHDLVNSRFSFTDARKRCYSLSFD
ncbi:winged helix-turn-helix domain-containing protein [Haladaptatus sp. R4]|uniref:winged helix-turn-helix domain-containing protein n=1 Tax=Haladaptatus sp. R4 TaxID=1679489 RepID=UPI000AE109B3|nr:winged helix-turn-helix domain-containing protein [Haladaptatus sp. R4]